MPPRTSRISNSWPEHEADDQFPAIASGALAARRWRREKCRRDATGPASNKCRCNPCSGSSAHWPATPKPDRPSCRPITVAAPRPAISSSTSSAIFDVVLLIAAERAADRIQQKALGLVDRVLREVFISQASGPPRHFGSDGLFRCGNRFWYGQGISPYDFTLMFLGFLKGRNAMKSA